MNKPVSAAVILLLILISLMHVLRLVLHISVTVGGIDIPMWVSIFGVVIPAVLAMLLRRERESRSGTVRGGASGE